MNVLELVTAARQRLDSIGDGAADYWITDDSDSRWSNVELVDYLNQAQIEYASRVPIVDSTTSADSSSIPLCSLTLVAGTSRYAISPKILNVKRAFLASTKEEICKISEHGVYLDTSSTFPSTLTYYQLDQDMNAITFIAAPTIADTVTFTVERLPLSTLTWTANTESPEIRERDHYHLIHWMEYLARLKGDEETADSALASRAAERFTRQVGPPVSAANERIMRDLSDNPLQTRTCY